jgi:hypothetical protein
MQVPSSKLFITCLILGTRGTIVKPTNTLQLDCYVNAHFAGLYKCDPDASPTSTKPFLGFIVSLGRVPLVWCSQLQLEISVSILESEYSSLLQAMHTLLPICSLFLEVVPAIGLEMAVVATIHARVFEGNNGAYLLATNQCITNHTKYYLVKWQWHFFWNAVWNGEVTVLKVDTLHQGLDYLTKGLAHEAFERICKINQGW